MNLTKTALKRPVAVVVCIIALILFGATSIFSTPLELIPEMEMPVYLVVTTYPGAGPQEVNDLVSEKVEDAVSTVSGLKNLDSRSMENLSFVITEMEYGTDMDRTYMELQKKLNTIQNQLPEDVDPPTIVEMNMNAMPVIMFAVSGPESGMDILNYLNDSVVPEFEKLNGTAEVKLMGGREKYIQVKIDQEKMKQYGLSQDAISQYLGLADFSYPAGDADRGDLNYTLRGGVEYDTVSKLKTMPLTLKSGDIIHLSDIAEVAKVEKEADSISRYNGSETILMSITKRDSAGTVDVTTAAKEVMELINADSSGIKMDIVMDQSEDIIDSLMGVVNAMISAILISMVVLYVFLGDMKASFVVGTSMPLSVLTTMIIMAFCGISFNMLSLGGLTIGVGMMVDNSIVILDSCFKEHENKRTFKQAALEGARIVTSAVVASTATTVVVFLPIGLMQGMAGQLFSDVAITVVISLIASLISALTLVPLLFFRLQPREREDIPASRIIDKVNAYYATFMRKTFKRKKSVVFVAVLLLIGSFLMVPFIGIELMPATDSGQITVDVKTKPGLRLEKTEELITDLEQKIATHPDLDRYSVQVKKGGGEAAASFTMYLKDDREMSTFDIVDSLREKTKGYIDCEITVNSSSGTGSTGGSDQVSFNLIGNDRYQLEEVSKQVKTVMEQQEGVINVTSSLSDGNPQAEIKVDPVKSNAVGLPPKQVIGTINTIMNGKNAATITMEGQDYDVYVEYPGETYQNLNAVLGMVLTTSSGREVPLLDIATVEYSASPQSISRHNSQYTVEIVAHTQMKNAAKINQKVVAAANQIELPQGVDHYMGGQAEQMAEEFKSIFSALGTAVFLVFMVMAIQFESTKFSLMVMISIPFSLIGAFGGLLATGTTISMTSLMGFIMLAGIVVNNAIVLIDYANQLREAGMDIQDALVESGCSRLRPILMTTLTTVLGMVPLAIGLGSNAETMRGMAMVIIGGLTASTVLTLVLIPTMYLIFAGKESKKKYDEDSLEPTDTVIVP